MDQEQVKRSQKKILKRIFDCDSDESESEESTGILKTIKSYTEEDAIYAMGDFGKRLRDFALSVDLFHPDIKTIFDGELVGVQEGAFSKDATDLLKLAAHGRAWNLSANVLENLKRVLSCHDCLRSLKSNIDDPSGNLQHVRFLSNRSDRSLCRSSKVSQDMKLSTLWRGMESYWNEQPKNFDWVMRGRMVCADDIKLAEKKKKHFDDHGLRSMSELIGTSIEEMQKFSWDSAYCKFNKISLTTVAIVLGKMMGYRYGDGRAFAPREIFEPQLEMFEDSMPYLPKIYGVDDLVTPPEMERVIDFLEKYPDMGGKPLFDHYRVFVPSVEHNRYESEYSPTLYDSFSEKRIYQQSQKSIDTTLMSRGLMLAVLLGERDGDHYFISYWM